MEASRAKSRSKKKGGISKLQRWLDLIAFLLHRSTPATAEEILSRIPSYALKWGSGDERSRTSAGREFERDKEELRAFGVAIETRKAAVPVDGERYAGYRLERRGFYLPLLCLASAGDGRDSWGRGPASGEVVIRDEGGARRDRRPSPCGACAGPPAWSGGPVRAAEAHLRSRSVRVPGRSGLHRSRLPRSGRPHRPATAPRGGPVRAPRALPVHGDRREHRDPTPCGALRALVHAGAMVPRGPQTGPAPTAGACAPGA
jgi:hypothetical protein